MSRNRLGRRARRRRRRPRRRRDILLGSSRPRGDDPRHGLHPRLHGRDPLRPPALLLPAEHRLPLRRLPIRRRVGPTRHHLFFLPLPQLPGLLLRRLLRRPANLHLHPLRPRLSPQLRPQLPRQHTPHVCPANRLPRLRPRPRRRHCQAGKDRPRGEGGAGCAGVLQRQFHFLFYPYVLVQPFSVAHFCGQEGVLFQHRGYGDRSGSVEGRGLYNQNRGVDGASEANSDLRIGFPAAFLARLRRRNRPREPPVEPARSGRGQFQGALPGFASGAGELAALEREREAVGPARRQSAVSA
ncbi:unnamed protein product [Linum tenue]|uniref:Uncharacterized protein n=1 Tax=Linum tenue TaxID=586396 RepID=A0AAV0P360_9ROSI|nr:unnamed protein product [Linum tenue]